MNRDNRNIFVTIASQGPVVNAHLHGPSFGERESDIIVTELKNYFEQHPGSKHVILDFKDITFLNSAGISGCLKRRTLTEEFKANLILHNLDSSILEVLRITRLDRIFSIAKNDKHLTKLTR